MFREHIISFIGHYPIEVLPCEKSVPSLLVSLPVTFIGVFDVAATNCLNGP